MRLRDIRRIYPLSPDGVAAIHVVGKSPLGAKSLNLHGKRDILDRCGFLFPRRNLVVTQDVLVDALVDSGLSGGWNTNNKLDRRDYQSVRRKFMDWAKKTIWPILEELFVGRAFYIRSDAPGDSLGRGVYSSEPFVNSHVNRDYEARAESFASLFFAVTMSHFNEAAIRFRKRFNIHEDGINVLCSQFIGRPGDFLLGGNRKRALAPFLSAVVKTTLVAGTKEGLIRFEYGLGSGALVGRTILVHGSETETMSGKRKMNGVVTDLHHATPEVVVLPDTTLESVDPSNYAVMEMLMNSAYPKIETSVEENATRMLEYLATNLQEYQRLNGNIPLYLELVSSSFRRAPTHWFAVQASDYEPINPLPAPPETIDFSSNKDFCGHGLVQGRKRIYLFGKDTFNVERFDQPSNGKTMLKQLNETCSDFVTILPQQALTGTNLTSMDDTHFLCAAAVIEYERLHASDLPYIVHRSGPSSEHFEQLMLDFERLFIPVSCPFPKDITFRVGSDQVFEVYADVKLACDRERGVAWGKIDNIKVSAVHTL